MSTANYMDYFSSPEEFIRFHVTARSKFSVIDRDGLIEIARSNGISIGRNVTKVKILNLILEKMSLEEFAGLLNCGVRSGSFQQKFGITHKDVKRMAQLGVIQVTGSERVRLYGKYCDVDLYSVFDYFRLTREAVYKWLAKNPKGTKNNGSVSW